MNISVERQDWLKREPELVVLIGDPYSDFIGPLPGGLQEKVNSYATGFAEGTLKREIAFSSTWGDSAPLDFIYYHSSTSKGFTATENLKTFVSRALHSAAETGRKRVCLLLNGAQGEGLIEQVVEGSLVGTYAFREYKKDPSDPFESTELIIALPLPQSPEVVSQTEESDDVSALEVQASAEVVEPVDDPNTELSSSDSEQATTEESQEVSEPGEEETIDSDPSEEAATEEAQAEPEAQAELEVPVQSPAESEPVDQALLDSFRETDESALAVGRAFADGVNLARELVARPAAECTPEYLAKRAKKIASTYGFSYQDFGPKQLAQHEYAGLVAVGKGADNAPRMIEMTYTPETESDVHLVLLGKGVTFDSGGISIKAADNMHLMIGDMAGAAAVLGAMEVLGRLRPSIKVTGLIVSAENKPGSKSYRPGDIIRYKNGISVHVENTDAEGRLILADGLIRAGELAATHIIDLATLTGAASRALGPSFTGVMGANRKLVNAITRAGGNHGESYWRLPMPLEYKEMLKTVHADLNNMGGPYAGATTAALFLQEFVPARTAWAHLDIAGTFWKQKPWKYYKEGPSGTGVKTIADLALRWTEHLG